MTLTPPSSTSASTRRAAPTREPAARSAEDSFERALAEEGPRERPPSRRSSKPDAARNAAEPEASDPADRPQRQQRDEAPETRETGDERDAAEPAPSTPERVGAAVAIELAEVASPDASSSTAETAASGVETGVLQTNAGPSDAPATAPSPVAGLLAATLGAGVPGAAGEATARVSGLGPGETMQRSAAGAEAGPTEPVASAAEKPMPALDPGKPGGAGSRAVLEEVARLDPTLGARLPRTTDGALAPDAVTRPPDGDGALASPLPPGETVNLLPHETEAGPSETGALPADKAAPAVDPGKPVITGLQAALGEFARLDKTFAAASPQSATALPLPASAAAPTLAAPSLAAPLGEANRPPLVVADVPLSAVPVEIGLRSLAGVSRFEIRLDPKELGRIDVRLDIEGGEVKAQLVVDRVETLGLLQREARNLERAFEQAGLKPSEGGLDLSLRDPGAQAGQDGRGERRGEREPRAEAVEPATRHQRPPVETSPRRIIARGLAGIDLRI